MKREITSLRTDIVTEGATTVAALAVSRPASAFASWLKLCTHQSVASRRSTGRAAGNGASSCTGRRGSAVGGSLASNTTPASTNAA